MASRATLALKSAENLRRSLFISTSKLLLIRLSRKSGVLQTNLISTPSTYFSQQ
jgi:hypothetical protein